MLTQEELDKLLEEGGLDDSGGDNSAQEGSAQEASTEQKASDQASNGQAKEADSSNASNASGEQQTSSDTSTDDIDWSDAFKEAASGGDSAALKAMKDGSVDEVMNEMKKEQPKAQSADFNEFKSSEAPKQESATSETMEHPNLDFIMDLPLDVSVELGRCRMPIRELLQLGQGSVVELNKMAGEPADIYVNQKLMAKGEIVVVNEKFGVRLTEIISPADRVKGLG